MAADLIIPDAAFPAVAAQRGALDPLKGDREAWETAYRASLAADLADIRPFLPLGADHILDVGGGVSGIGALLLQRRFAGARLSILDGEGEAMRRHDEPFGCWAASEAFLRANGVTRFSFVEAATARDPEAWKDMSPVDLVLSFQAWGFHFAPGLYLDYVGARLRKGSRLILDVRRARRDWAAELASAFEPIGVAREAAKYRRLVYAAR